ncbi:MAG: hypothetical protein J1F05_01975 [Muribaculaceae bacterium]|nr:hypothetical protein [Muribaculaceae bacterium]
MKKFFIISALAAFLLVGPAVVSTSIVPSAHAISVRNLSKTAYNAAGQSRKITVNYDREGNPKNVNGKFDVYYFGGTAPNGQYYSYYFKDQNDVIWYFNL